jgi:hypothetical protein
MPGLYKGLFSPFTPCPPLFTIHTLFSGRNLLKSVKLIINKFPKIIAIAAWLLLHEEELKLLDKNNWLNLVLGILGFYSVFSVMEILMGRYGTKVVAVTKATTNISQDFYWLISFGAALILSLVLIIIFCKPRTPLFVCIGILIGSCLSMFSTLYHTILNLDKYFRANGLSALQFLLPHAAVIVGALIAFLIAWVVNRGGSQPSAQ